MCHHWINNSKVSFFHHINTDFAVKSFETKITLKPRMKEDEARNLLESYKGNTVNLMGKTCNTLENIINAWKKGEPEQTHLSFLQTIIKLGNFVFVLFPYTFRDSLVIWMQFAKLQKKHNLFIIEDACQADGGTTLAFKFKTEEDAQKFATSKGIDGVLPIDTGKHIYKHWTPVMEKRGSLHPLMDPFKMEANKDIVPDYTDDMC